MLSHLKIEFPLPPLPGQQPPAENEDDQQYLLEDLAPLLGRQRDGHLDIQDLLQLVLLEHGPLELLRDDHVLLATHGFIVHQVRLRGLHSIKLKQRGSFILL